jgi:DUF1707 SHOCT-like domain
MPVTPQDRPLAALREETVDQLIMNYGHGRLSREAFERRLDEAFEAQSHERLLELVSDLDLKTDKEYAEQKRAELGLDAAEASASASPRADEVDHIVNVFGGTHRRGPWDVPREIRIFNLFGGADLDFSQARFTAKTTHVTMVCIFGGANFYVREDMRTTSKVLSIFGGVDNRAPSSPDPAAPKLVITGLALFGSAHIRVRKSAKERLREFAQTLRGMFDPAEPPRA